MLLIDIEAIWGSVRGKRDLLSDPEDAEWLTEAGVCWCGAPPAVAMRFRDERQTQLVRGALAAWETPVGQGRARRGCRLVEGAHAREAALVLSRTDRRLGSCRLLTILLARALRQRATTPHLLQHKKLENNTHLYNKYYKLHINKVRVFVFLTFINNKWNIDVSTRNNARLNEIFCPKLNTS